LTIFEFKNELRNRSTPQAGTLAVRFSLAPARHRLRRRDAPLPDARASANTATLLLEKPRRRNAVPVIFQSLSGNANPIDPAYFVSPDAEVDANVLVAGYAKMLPLFDRTLTLAVLEPMGRISGETTVAGNPYN